MKPTQSYERHAILDVVRGFALCGVLIANMATHSGYYFLTEDARQALPFAAASDEVFWGIHFITDGKFYSIFSLLFGIGFGLQIQRAMEKGEKFGGLFSRRLGILFVFGLLHAVLLYVGDILMVYALLGFVLMLFRRTSTKNLLRWSLALLILPVIQYAIMWWPYQSAGPLEIPRNPMLDQLLTVYQSGSFGETVYMNIGGIIFGRYPELIFTGRFFRVLAMFVLGFYVARRALYADLTGNRRLFKTVLIWGMIIGIPCNIALAFLMETNWYMTYAPQGILEPLVYAFGVPALGLAYAAGLALLYPSARYQKILNIFAPYGRMALTNYLMQSVIACLIFTGYGMGYYGQVAPAVLTVLAVIILVFQIIFSAWWLKKFQYGPMEWLWRSMTYRKWQPIQKPSDKAVTQEA